MQTEEEQAEKSQNRYNSRSIHTHMQNSENSTRIARTSLIRFDLHV